MDLTQLANLGEFIGGVAVLVTLIYLAYQLRQNNRSDRVSTLCAMSEASASLSDMIASDPELSRIIGAGMQSPRDLAPEDRERFHFLMMGMARRMEGIFIRMEAHAVPPQDRRGYQESGLSSLAMSGSRVWWDRHRTRFNPTFSAWVSAELAQRAEGRGDAL